MKSKPTVESLVTDAAVMTASSAAHLAWLSESLPGTLITGSRDDLIIEAGRELTALRHALNDIIVKFIDATRDQDGRKPKL